VNATVSVSEAPGASVVPSGRAVVGVKAPPLGGLDFVIVMFVPPLLVTVNDFEAVPPTGTEPKLFVSLAICSTPAAPALPERPTPWLPALVSRTISSA
jgi:hypothetical protein